MRPDIAEIPGVSPSGEVGGKNAQLGPDSIMRLALAGGAVRGEGSPLPWAGLLGHPWRPDLIELMSISPERYK